MLEPLSPEQRVQEVAEQRQRHDQPEQLRAAHTRSRAQITPAITTKNTIAMAMLIRSTKRDSRGGRDLGKSDSVSGESLADQVLDCPCSCLDDRGIHVKPS